MLYWMSRDQRVRDNWALLHAQETAAARLLPTKPCRTRVGNREWRNRPRTPTQDPSTHLACLLHVVQARGAPLAVVFNLVPGFLGATIRQYGFMLSGPSQLVFYQFR